MNIAIDITSAFTNNPTGIGKVGKEYFSVILNQVLPHNVTFCYRFSRRLKLTLPTLQGLSKTRLKPLWNGLWLKRKINLFHGMDNYLPQPGPQLNLLTLYDLIVFSDQNFCPPAWKNQMKKKILRIISRANYFCVPSELTRQAFLNIFPHYENQIRVIPLGVSNIFFHTRKFIRKEILGQFNITKPFVLFIGTIEKRKNILRIIKGFNKIREKKSFQLVLVGKAGFGAEEILSEIRKTPEILRLSYVEDDPVLAQLYAQAQLFLYPSLQEGFGLPVLEAMASGTPVITSKNSPMEEFSKGAAILVDPASEEEISRAIEEVLYSGEQRSKMIEAGIKISKTLTWEENLTKTVKLYQEIVK